MKLKQAPKASSGDVIELEPLLGKAVAVKVTARRKVETKFGERELSEVVMLPEGAKEPIEGVLFQAYFAQLETGEWFVGVIRKDEKRWYLEPATPRQVKALESVLDQIEDIPF